MKQYTSKFLKSVAIFYFALPLLHVIVGAVLFDIAFSACVRIFLSPLYWFTSALAVSVGYGLWEMKRWVWYFLILTNIFIVYENALWVNEFGESHHKAFAFLFSLFMVAALTYRVSSEIRVPYFFPKIRWWESDPRYRLSVPVTLARNGNTKLNAEILDLSASGCFVKLRSALSKDEPLSLSFTVFGYPVRCEGVVVWCTQSTVTHPRGIGIKFMNLGKAEKRHLKFINRRLKKIAALYRRSRYLMNQDEFLKHMEEIDAPSSEKRGIG